MAVPGVNAAPTVDDHRGAKTANHLDHIVQDLVAPDFFRFFRCLGVAEVFGAGEKEFDAITPCGGKQFLRANQAKLGSLLWPEIVLAAFATSQGKQRDIGVQAAREISKDGGGFVIGVSGDVQDARGYAGAFDGFDGFGETNAGARGGRELGFGGRCEQQEQKSDG